MNIEWIVAGVILLGGMTAGGVSLYLKRRSEAQISGSFEATKVQSDSEPEKDGK
jgi:hypothetical protein